MPDGTSGRLRRADPEQCRPQRRPARAQGAGDLAPRLHRLVAATWGRRGSRTALVYLRTAVGVDAEGWAKFGYVRMPEYRWGILLAPAVEERHNPVRRAQGRAGLAGGAGRIPRDAAPPAGDPGRHRTRVGRAAAPSRRHRALALRPAQPVPGECRGRPASLGDGLPAAKVFRPRRARGSGGTAAPPLRRSRHAAHARRVQRGDAGLAVASSCSPSSPTATARCSLAALAQSGFDPLSPHLPLHADRGSAPHVRRRDRRAAHHRSAPARRCRRPASTIRPTSSAVRRAGRDRPADDRRSKINLHFSLTLDLFGNEISTNAANAFNAGLKGRYREDTADRRPRC